MKGSSHRDTEAATADPEQRMQLFTLMFPQRCSGGTDGSRQLLLPRVNGAGHGVVAVIHSVWRPAVAPHTLGAVVSAHGQVLKKMIQEREDR